VGSPRSPVRTRPLPLPRYRAPGAVAGSHAADGSAPRARRWSGRPVGGLRRDRPVAPSFQIAWAVGSNSRDSFSGVRPDRTRSPFVAGIPAHRVGDIFGIDGTSFSSGKVSTNRVTPMLRSKSRTILLAQFTALRAEIQTGRPSRRRSYRSMSPAHRRHLRFLLCATCGSARAVVSSLFCLPYWG